VESGSDKLIDLCRYAHGGTKANTNSTNTHIKERGELEKKLEKESKGDGRRRGEGKIYKLVKE